jgi:NADPH-dependent curcumin reductase CurA
MTIRKALKAVHEDESGHALPGAAALAGAIGAILLGIGAANDSGVLAIAGGIIAGVGFLASSLLEHVTVDYGLYDRIEKLEKK